MQLHNLKLLLAERISSGLSRKSITTCSRWAEKYRVMGIPFPGPWTFKWHPWLRGMHDSTSPVNIGQKAAQVGFTETVLNTVFYNIDMKAIDCLYVLPANSPHARDFSAGRFDPALDLSAHLQNLFSDVKNVGHKRAGNTNLYIRGSRSKTGLKSIPTGVVVLDEVDEFEQDNIPLALERQAGQLEKLTWLLSTPSIPKYGINKYFERSSQDHFYFKCPACSRHIELLFPQSLEIVGENAIDPRVSESYIKCYQCQAKLEHKLKHEFLANGVWKESIGQMEERGFYVNQLYSSTVEPGALVKSYFIAQEDPAEEQQLYNSKFGLAHIVKGAGITDANIDSCIGNYKSIHTYTGGRLTTIGIDVGKFIHYEIDEWDIPGAASIDLNVRSRPRVLSFGKVLHFEELDELMYRYRIVSGIIDALPERRKAFEFASRFPNIIRLCFYPNGIHGKQIQINKEEEATVSVDRTSWLDLSLGRFKNSQITLPVDINHEYRIHLKALVRIYERDPQGNLIGKYVRGSDQDHYAHCRNYNEIALPFGLSLVENSDIQSFM